MPELTTDFGETFWTRNDVRGTTFTIALYNQASDGLGENSDVGDITTEPTGSSYARQTETLVYKSFSDGTHGVYNDATIQFDTSDSGETVDHAALIADDINANTHLMHIAPLNDSRNLSDFAQISIEPDQLQIKAD